jgi:hypothetical protein
MRGKISLVKGLSPVFLAGFLCIWMTGAVLSSPGPDIRHEQAKKDLEDRHKAWAKILKEQKTRRNHLTAEIEQQRKRVKEAKRLYEQILCFEYKQYEDAERARMKQIEQSRKAQEKQKQAQLAKQLSEKEVEREKLKNDLQAKKKQLTEADEARRSKDRQARDQERMKKEGELKERIEARRDARAKLRLARLEKNTAGRAEDKKAQAPRPQEKDEASRIAAMDKSLAALSEAGHVPGSLKEQESSFLAEQKNKENQLREEEKKRVQAAREEAASLRERRKQERLKEQQARKEEELRIVQESRRMRQKASKKSQPGPEEKPKPAEQKEQPVTAVQTALQQPMQPESSAQQLTPEQLRQRQADALKTYASQIKGELIDRESSKIRSPDTYDSEQVYEAPQAKARPATRIIKSNPRATEQEMIRKEAMESSFKEEDMRKPLRRPGPSRDRAIKNKLDKMDAWLEDNLW